MISKRRCSKANPKISSFDASCFDGHYITGDISADYLNRVEARRSHGKASDDVNQMALDLAKPTTRTLARHNARTTYHPEALEISFGAELNIWPTGAA